MINYSDEHEAYAASRGKEYVYVSNNINNEQALDDYIDGVENTPLVVIGKRESGKSSLLSNWLRKRSEGSPNDFYFAHFCGCSPQNFHLQRMLFRLETALKIFFNLQGHVPKTEEKLRWGLNRFLEAASKKELNVKIIVIIDGANLIRSEDNPPGKLHWLPTKMPSCVRFILSTVELDESTSNYDSSLSRDHRTYTELVKRRQCPMIRLDALKLQTRIQIIRSFSQREEKSDDQSTILTIDQSLKIAKSRHASQPFYLRLLLTAIHLGKEISNESVDEQLDRYSNSNNIKHLLAQILHECASYVEPGRNRGKSILYFILSVLHASRHGLKDDEIWGIVEFKYETVLNKEIKKRIRLILKNFSMKVKGCHIYSHNFIQDAIFDFYISKASTYIQLHHIMASFFASNMMLCDRKLSCLVWHLEVSGSWKRLKNILVDVENFHLWWTQRNKDEFLDLWSSLTLSAQKNNCSNSTLVTGIFYDKWMKCNQSPRPFYDPVEEYTKSIESHRSKVGMPDEFLTSTLLKVSDFLLEFAILGREQRGDVPNFHHPNISNDEMRRLGVPYLGDDDGVRSIFIFPKQNKLSSHTAGIISSEKDDLSNLSNHTPTHSAYMFRRWMWIYFPLLALGNFKDDNDRVKNEEKSNEFPVHVTHSRPATAASYINTKRRAEEDDQVYLCQHINPALDSDSTKNTVSKMHIGIASNISLKKNEKSIMNALNKIKSQHNSLIQKKMELLKLKKSFDTEYVSLQGDNIEIDEKNQKIEIIQKRIEKTEVNKIREANLYAKYESVLKSCAKNPAYNRALLYKFEAKLEEDHMLIEKCIHLKAIVLRDTQLQLEGHRRMKSMIEESKELYKLLLQNRSQDRSNFLLSIEGEEANQEESTKFLRDLVGNETIPQGQSSTRDSETIKTSEDTGIEVDEKMSMEYLEIEEKLKHRTSFCDISSFASRLISSQIEARQQITKIQKNSEERISLLQNEVTSKKEELQIITEKTGKGSSFEGNELIDKETRFSSSNTNMLKWKEKVETIEILMRELRHGIESIGVTLGMSFFSSSDSTLTLLEKVRKLLSIVLRGGSNKVEHGKSDSGTMKKIEEEPEENDESMEFNKAMEEFNTNRIKIASRIQGGPSNEANSTENREERSELHGNRQIIKASSKQILNSW